MAKITTLDVMDAREAPGVVMVLTAADIAAHGLKNAMKGSVVDNHDGTKGAAPVRPILADTACAPCGGAVAFIVAETLAQARDAAELIELDIDELPGEARHRAGGEPLHDECPTMSLMSGRWAMRRRRTQHWPVRPMS
jgi:carbon-monoxide dehydrogenase large subunit